MQTNRQMVFVAGPRQVGKTTLCRTVAGSAHIYFDWDDLEQRGMILEGSTKIAAAAGLDRLSAEKPIAVFDEIHKYSDWKLFLKGLFDRFGEDLKRQARKQGEPDRDRHGGR